MNYDELPLHIAKSASLRRNSPVPLLLPPFAGSATTIHPVVIIRDVIVRPREQSGAVAAGQTIRVRPPSSPLLSSPTHHAHYFLKIWNQTDRQTDRDGGGDGGGMALPKNGKSPMQKGETKRGSKWWLQKGQYI